MRILLLPASYPPVFGGLQTVAHTLAQCLTTQGHELQVVANRYPRSLPQEEVLDGVQVRRELFLTPQIEHLRQRRPDLFLAALAYYPHTLRHLDRLFHEFQPQVVNVHFPDGQIPFVLSLRRRFRFRLVVSLHGHEVLRWFDRLGHMAAGYLRKRRVGPLVALLRRADAVTACSQYLLDCAVALEPSVARKGVVIHNGIDASRFEDTSKHRRNRPYLLAFGRLTHKKGFDLLLDAFADLASQHPDLDLVLAGEGEERTALEQQARRLGIEGRVELYGRATQQEIVRLLNGCQLQIIPSRQETFGIAALEGLAAGKPVLATRVGGIPEVVQVPPNVLIEPTSDELLKGLVFLLDQIELSPTYAMNNRVVAGTFTWNTALAAYVDVFERI